MYRPARPKTFSACFRIRFVVDGLSRTGVTDLKFERNLPKDGPNSELAELVKRITNYVLVESQKQAAFDSHLLLSDYKELDHFFDDE